MEKTFCSTLNQIVDTKKCIECFDQIKENEYFEGNDYNFFLCRGESIKKLRCLCGEPRKYYHKSERCKTCSGKTDCIALRLALRFTRAVYPEAEFRKALTLLETSGLSQAIHRKHNLLVL